MGVSTSIVVEQIAIMFLVMAVGFVLYRADFIDDRGAAQMSDLVLYVANPVLIAQALMRGFDAALLEGALWVSVVAAVTLVLALVLGRVLYGADAVHERAGRFAILFSNAGFIGIPLAQALVGSDGVFYISVANTVQTSLMWTYGVWLVSGDRTAMSWRKVLFNPALIAMVIGLACFATSWRPPVVIDRALDVLGSLNTGLVMLVLGAYLGQCRVRAVARDGQIYKVCAARLLVMPALTLAVLAAMNALVPTSEAARLTGLLYQAMPVAAVASLFAHRFGSDSDFATGAVAMSTLCSLATLPVWIAAYGVLFGAM